MHSRIKGLDCAAQQGQAFALPGRTGGEFGEAFLSFLGKRPRRDETDTAAATQSKRLINVTSGQF
jgi:hypothetical protein